MGNSRSHLPQVVFVFAIGGVFYGWRWFKANVSQFPVLDQVFSNLNDVLAASMAKASQLFLHLFGYEVELSERFVFVDTFTRIEVSDGCVGVGLYIMFLAFVGFFPGKQTSKLWYIPLGFLIILLGNTFRIIGMVYTQLYIPASFEFMHLIVLRGSMFVVLILLCVIWVNYSIGSTWQIEDEEP